MDQTLRARLPFAAPVCSQFVGRLERTCGAKAQQSIDSEGIRTQDLQHLRASGRRSYQLSYQMSFAVNLWKRWCQCQYKSILVSCKDS